MKISRKKFLKMTIAGGLGTLSTGAVMAEGSWFDKGVRLLSVRRQSVVMGSIISFEVIASNKQDGYEAIRRAMRIFRKLERLFTMYNADSEMGQLEQHAGKTFIPLSEYSLGILKAAKEIYHQTQGSFDVTLEPVMRRWGFRKRLEHSVTPPTDRELKRMKSFIGSDQILVKENNAMLKKHGMAIDLGGIGGGYALDQSITEMKKMDVAAAYINFGGDIHCFGKPLTHQCWNVFLLNPETKEPLTDPVNLHDEALSTSGSYQNRRSDETTGNSWGHLFSANRLKPVEPYGSVTAIHPSALQADAWSTARYVGAEPGPGMEFRPRFIYL